MYMNEKELDLLRKYIPRTYLINKVDGIIFPNPIQINNKTLVDINNIIYYSKSNNFNFILKTSGFSDSHSTSKGITELVNESSKGILNKFNKVNSFKEQFILQEKISSKEVKIEYFDVEKKVVATMIGKTRLTPYYFFSPDSDSFHFATAHIVVRNNPDVHFANDAVVTSALIF